MERVYSTDGYYVASSELLKENKYVVEFEDTLLILMGRNPPNTSTTTSVACLEHIFHSFYPNIQSIDANKLEEVLENMDNIVANQSNPYIISMQAKSPEVSKLINDVKEKDCLLEEKDKE